MNSSSYAHLAAVFAMALSLAACGGRSESYRYKLTMAVNTPDGVKKASSAVEATFWPVSIPASGIMNRLSGQAVYLDLGVGRRPLIALLTTQLHPKPGKDVRWSRDRGPALNLLDQLYGPVSPDLLAGVARIASVRDIHKIVPNDLPDLVTFADVDDPATVVEIDRNDLQATLGAGISWNEITLESTNEPITTGIVKKLPWLSDYRKNNLRLDGSNHGAGKDLANILSWFDFDQSDDLKRTSAFRDSTPSHRLMFPQIADVVETTG
jgi:hypothetical protein